MSQNKFNLGQVSTNQMLGLIILAYLFSFAIRLIWVFQFQDNPNFIWNNELMINTNDGYFFASGAQQALDGLHSENPRVFGLWDYGVIFFTTLFTKITPFSLETVILYMPSVISSLVVIPMILIARLYKQTLWGFFAALLGSITWSYYNRTMTGYYDTDMFSAMAPMFILFFLMKSTVDFNLRSALYAGLAIIIYPFLYDQGQAIIYAIGIIYGVYMLWFHRDSNTTYASLILVFIALIPLSLDKPLTYIVHIGLLLGVYFLLKMEKLQEKKLLMIAAGSTFLLFLLLGDVFGLIWGKVISYTIVGTTDSGLHFYAVNQTVREAGSIPFETFANRTSGSIWGVLIALIGYVVLVFRRPVFILALPLIGIGIFSLWGGLRFTVYAVPIAAMSAIYLLFVFAEQIKSDSSKYAFIAVGTALMIYPNITHIINYRVPTVLNKIEVEDLVKLNSIAESKDYTLSWWDYGYPIWYYSDTSTLIDGGKHNNDNFIISKIMFSTSPEQVANLSRLAVETYATSDNPSIVADSIFKDVNPNRLLNNLKKADFKLPKKTRDIYLYLPFRMLNIFPTVGVFGNLNLKTGKKQRNIIFYPTVATQQSGTKVFFQNGIVFDSANGSLKLGKSEQKVYRFDQVKLESNAIPKVESGLLHLDGNFCIVNLQSYNKVIIMDKETYNSAYVQMFMLGNYDKNLFELVVSSAYSKIYRVKK
jgi:dolichyl-diphosphooligosaccharide--protein glycosyltransferase/undecaprenyl-diphosphooligosaccharide--protein glycosyltransferase